MDNKDVKKLLKDAKEAIKEKDFKTALKLSKVSYDICSIFEVRCYCQHYYYFSFFLHACGLVLYFK